MKKILFLAIATLTLAACNNDDNYVDEPVAAQITATIGQSAVTRASGTSWTEGDSIGISMSGNGVNYVNKKYTTENGDGAFTGTTMYFKNNQEKVTLTAYYPFAGTENSAPTVEASTTAENQKAGNQPKIDFLYAKKENVTGSEPKVDLTFTHQMSKLTFKFIKGNDGTDVSKILSYQIEGLILDGTFDTETGICAVKDIDPETLIIATSGVQTEAELPSLILFPQATAGKTVKLRITDSDEQYYACTLNFGDDGIVAGNNYLYTITVSKTGLSVNSSITDWNTIDDLESEAKSED